MQTLADFKGVLQTVKEQLKTAQSENLQREFKTAERDVIRQIEIIERKTLIKFY